MSIESMMLTNHLILCLPLLLQPQIFPSIRVFSNELAFCIRWPKYQSFIFSISPFNEYSGLISCRIDWFDLLAHMYTIILSKYHYFFFSNCNTFYFLFFRSCTGQVLEDDVLQMRCHQISLLIPFLGEKLPLFYHQVFISQGQLEYRNHTSYFKRGNLI